MLTEKVKKERLVPLSFDPMFKKVFGDENDKETLKYLLNMISVMILQIVTHKQQWKIGKVG